MYTLVAVYVGARVIDFVQEGAYSARGAFIISDKQNEIADLITNKLSRGVTILNGHGHFTKSSREVIYCVVAKNQISALKSVISSIDPHAFVSITEVKDVMGEGFTLDDEKNPID